MATKTHKPRRTLPHTDKTPGVLTTIVVEVELPLNPAPRTKRAPLSVSGQLTPPRGGSWATRRQALRGHIERARGLARVVRLGTDSNVAEVAEQEGISAVRVRQLLYLLNLAPEILADIENPEAHGPVPPEAILRKLAGLRPLVDQIKAYREMTAQAAPADTDGQR